MTGLTALSAEESKLGEKTEKHGRRKKHDRKESDSSNSDDGHGGRKEQSRDEKKDADCSNIRLLLTT